MQVVEKDEVDVFQELLFHHGIRTVKADEGHAFYLYPNFLFGNLVTCHFRIADGIVSLYYAISQRSNIIQLGFIDEPASMNFDLIKEKFEAISAIETNGLKLF